MVNRYLCTVLEECRTALNNLNFLTIKPTKRILSTLVEEIQVLANRMEAGLEDNWEYNRDQIEHRKLKREIKQMEWQKADLAAEVEDLELVLEKQLDLDGLRTQIRQAKKELHKLKIAKNRVMEENENSRKQKRDMVPLDLPPREIIDALEEQLDMDFVHFTINRAGIVDEGIFTNGFENKTVTFEVKRELDEPLFGGEIHA